MCVSPVYILYWGRGGRPLHFSVISKILQNSHELPLTLLLVSYFLRSHNSFTSFKEFSAPLLTVPQLHLFGFWPFFLFCKSLLALILVRPQFDRFGSGLRSAWRYLQPGKVTNLFSIILTFVLSWKVWWWWPSFLLTKVIEYFLV